MVNDFFNEMDKIKNKAMSVNHALELQKEASLSVNKELVQKELEQVVDAAQKSADAKIEALDRVQKASKGSSDEFQADWRKAFGAVKNDFASFSSMLSGRSFSSGKDFKEEMLESLTSKNSIALMANVLQGVFGGFFADGGRPPQNKVSLVGERGPELFVPDTAGTILPNEALESKQMSPIVVNQQFSFQSLDPVTNMKMLQAQKSQIQTWVVDGIKNNTNGLRNIIEGV